MSEKLVLTKPSYMLTPQPTINPNPAPAPTAPPTSAAQPEVNPAATAGTDPFAATTENGDTEYYDYDDDEPDRPHTVRNVIIALFFIALIGALCWVWPQVFESIHAPNQLYSFNVKVRLAGDENAAWKDSIENAPIGAEFEAMIEYRNLSDDYQEDVVVQVDLGGLTEYVPDSTILLNQTTPDGMLVKQNTIVSEGLNIGTYSKVDESLDDTYVSACVVLRMRVSAGVLPGNSVQPKFYITAGGKTAEIVRQVRVASLTDADNPSEDTVQPDEGDAGAI